MEEETVKISRARTTAWKPRAEKASDGETESREIKGLQFFSDITMKRIEWFWYPYIAKGKLTILGGDPGLGKSFITTAIAAAVSRGEALPGEEKASGEIRRTLFFTAEDDPADTIKPRLQHMHADQTQIAVYPGSFIFDAEGIRTFHNVIRSVKPDLVIIDPIVAYLGSKMDMNRSNEVRPIMKALADAADMYSVAIIIVRHQRKAATNGKSGPAIYAGMGSIDFTAAVRSELQVTEASNGQKYINHVKANAGPKGKSIRYSINDGHFEWGEVLDVAPFMMNGDQRISKRLLHDDSVRQFLFDILRDHPDGLPSADILMMAKAAKISETKLKLVKRDVVHTFKEGERWKWKLLPEPKVTQEDAA